MSYPADGSPAEVVSENDVLNTIYIESSKKRANEDRWEVYDSVGRCIVANGDGYHCRMRKGVWDDILELLSKGPDEPGKYNWWGDEKAQ